MFPPPTRGEGPAAERPNLRLIARHQQRRLAGLPTVSVLLADLPGAKACWRRWIRNDRLAVEQTCADPHQLTVAVVDAFFGAMDLPLIALHFLMQSARSTALHRSPTASRHTPHDLETLADAAVAFGAAEEIVRAALEICRWPWSDRSSAQLVERIESALAGSTGKPWFRVLAALSALLPEELFPAILLSPPLMADQYAWLFASAGSIAELAETVPHWSITLAILPNEFERYARDAPASRAKSMLENGVVQFAMNEEGSPRAGATSNESPDATDVMKQVRPSPRLAESLETARALQPRQDELARSAAERLLFELLESHPRSQGRFVLNGNPGFNFGPRAAEVDLLATRPQLAIEVDGYFHFTDPASYRRDRRKDWELQRHGFLVLRVLAEDVVTRTGEVLDFILSAIDHCARQPFGRDGHCERSD